MKKIGILTIIDYKNYGNRLQNYATQEILKELGYKVETIVNYSHYDGILARLKYENFTLVLKVIKKIIRKKKRKELGNTEILTNKIKRFKEFTKKFISEGKETLYMNNSKEIDFKSFEKIVVGSDQIWNLNFRNNGNPNDFLQFVPKNKRIAFSPSFGVAELTEKQIKKCKKWIEEIPYLSCREDAGAKLIKKITERDAEVLVDPTMVLTKNKWEKFSKPQRMKSNKKYILTYFLGPLTEDDKLRVEKISKDNNLEIINLCDEKTPEIYSADPREWVNYIKGADLFLTDSFHGVVFSIIMETPFSIFNRGGKVVSMNSRIDTILEKFDFKNRHWDKLKESKDYFNINFCHCKKILETEREKSIKYLKNALEN